MKKLYIILSLVLTALLLCACSKTADDGGVSSVSSGETVKTDINTDQMDFEFTSNDLNYGYDESSAVKAGENEDIIKITAEGTYIVTGKHSQITVSAPDTAKIKIVLKNAAIENSTSPAIYITSADKVFITACEGTENTVLDGAEYSSEYTDSNVDAAIFSRADLTLNGRGGLTVKGNLKCGIASKDDLVICGLKLTVTSVGRGIEGKDCVKCSDASVTVNAGGDGIKSTNAEDQSRGYVYIESGSFNITAQNDGIHADDALIINGGDIKISKPYEGLEGTAVTVTGGKIDITASDDGINAAGGNDSSSLGGRPGENTFNSNSDTQINITGGYILVNASGDGVDSNGSVNMSGGVLLVSGPTNSGNGAFDYDSSAVITGGTAILCGSSGMAQGFSESSSQASFIYTLDSTSQAGDSLAVTDSSGKVIASFIPSKQYSNIVVSSPELTVGSSYTVTIGGTVSGCDQNGYTASGKVSGGEKSFSVELSSVSTSYGSAGGMGGGMGGKPERGNGGGKPFGMQG